MPASAFFIVLSRQIRSLPMRESCHHGMQDVLSRHKPSCHHAPANVLSRISLEPRIVESARFAASSRLLNSLTSP